ncbi:MAG: chitobiase/beta-hexosaminidase C-terminal domain-containing protein [Prevotella sp.]|nr:chitobiase/beta-hexosaminidase C-terminal domain-containing protein [Prevotella sp.]
MKQKLLTLLTLLLTVCSGAWAETENLAAASTDRAAYVGTSFTTSTNMMTTSTSGGYIKVRTGDNSNTWTFTVNDGYKITGIKIIGYSNNSNSNATITMTSMTVDGGSNILTSSDATVFPTGSSNAITLEKTDLEAESAIVCTFDNSNITSASGEKNKQLMVKITFTYVQTKVVTVAPTITLTGNSVTLASTTEGATIYYTTDGSTPTTSSAVYDGSFEISNSCTVRAFAQKEDVASNVVMRECYVTHSDALAVLGYNGGTLDSDSKVWTSTDGQYILTDESWTESNKRTIGYANLAGSQDGFKLNHTDYYTLKVGEDIKVTKIVVVGKSWLKGSAGNASTLAFDGFTPASGSFFDNVDETYVKTVEFIPESELNYGATITMRPGNNQLGAYIEVYGVKRSGPAEPVTGETITEVATINSDGTASSTVTPSGNASIITTSGNTTSAISKTCLKLESSAGVITIALPSSVSSASVTLLASVSSATSSSIKVNNGTAFVPSWSGSSSAGYTATIDITEYAGSNVTISKGSGTVNVAQITVTYSTGVEGQVDLTTTANMAGYRAFYDAENSYTVDENTKVYVATANSATKVTLAEYANNNIPAGTPVILKTSADAESDGTFKMTLTKDNTVADFSGINELKASTAGQNLGTVYRLGFGEDGVGFYKYTTSSAAAGIVYVENVSGGSGARSLTLDFADEATGIGASLMNSERGNSEVYNLNGQRVMNPAKGLYIVNGRKVVIK